MAAKVLFETLKYVVEEADGREIVGEDGKYAVLNGYVVVNRETKVVEHSTVMLPGAIFQCQHFNDTLVSLLSPPDEADIVEITSANGPEDILPN